MFYKNIFLVGLGVILLTVASCSGPEAEPSKAAAIVKDKQMGKVPEKPKEVSKKEKIKTAYVRLNEDEAYKKFVEMASKVYADGALPRKTKELIAVGISITSDCETCMRTHVRRAAKYGATEEEVFEAIMVAVEMGGGPAGVYALPAIEKMQDVYKK